MGRFDGRSLAGRELDSIDIECHLKDATMVRSLAFKHLIAWGRQSTRLELLLEGGLVVHARQVERVDVGERLCKLFPDEIAGGDDSAVKVDGGDECLIGVDLERGLVATTACFCRLAALTA